jgi:small subunit ribosomal protein S2
MTTEAPSSPVSMKALLEAGVHFGHQTHRWNPRMRQYIFTERNGIHIIDLQQTVPLLQQAMEFARSVAANGQTVLFVGTKKQAQDSIKTEAERSNSPYVINRWLGGTLTNFQTIESRIDYLVRLEDKQLRGEMDLMIKKEAGKLLNEMERMNRYFGGIKNMRRLPGALFVIDPPLERIAIAEAVRMRIPIIAMCDTNSNPDEIDYPIPANDDAIRAVKLVASKIADAISEGQTMRHSTPEAYEAPEGIETASLGVAGSYSASPEDPEPQAASDAEPSAPAAPSPDPPA